MRKTIKRLGAVLLAMAMAVSVLCTGALAAETYSITVNGKAGHTYQAYQIFTGTVSADGKTLSDIKWGTGVAPETFLSKLKENTAVGSHFMSITDANSNAEKIAEIIGEFADSSKEAYAVADAVEASVTATLESGTIAENATSTKITVSHAGYYLIKDANGSQDNSETVYTRNILKIVEPNTTITTKDAVPSLKKTITGINENASENVEANTAGIGDKINYKLTATVPDMSGYTSYIFKITDTMSKGLTFNNDVDIKIGDTTLSTDAFTVSTVTTDDDSGNQTFIITIEDFINYKDNGGKNIIVTYSATLNEKANLSSTNGNTNEAKITYSNDPNKSDSTGDTPTSKVKTYTTGLKLKKVANAADGKTLDGAKFKISGTGSKVILVNQAIYNKDNTTGTYYLKKDGSYTTTEPTDETEGTYDSTTQKYTKIDTVTKETVPATFETEAYVKDGVLKIEGLGGGTYTITELVAPDGYNLLTAPITITISASNVTFESCTWSIKNGDTELNVDTNDNTLYLLTVINKAGSTLPSTGGMGTKLFYTIGGILMAGAAIVLVVRKRRSDAE